MRATRAIISSTLALGDDGEGGWDVKFCYCDESGTGDEPLAMMVGVIVDAQRMHCTKHDWESLLSSL